VNLTELGEWDWSDEMKRQVVHNWMIFFVHAVQSGEEVDAFNAWAALIDEYRDDAVAEALAESPTGGSDR
jgi:hypothetical protein